MNKYMLLIKVYRNSSYSRERLADVGGHVQIKREFF